MSLRTELGVTGFHPRLVGTVDFFEMDSFDVSLQKLNFVKRLRSKNFGIEMSANYFYFRAKAAIPLVDRVNSLLDLCERTHARACNLKLNPAFFETQTLITGISRFEKEWLSRTALPLRLELPRSVPTSLTLHSRLILDPFWHKPKKSVSWKIHGWADSRWVRRYSDEELQSLVKKCIRFQPERLIFAHSQRVAQVAEYLELRSRMLTRNPIQTR
jgi:hypothetical protein